MSALTAFVRALVALSTLASLSLAMVPTAAAQAGVNGRNATAVDIGQGGRKLGELRQTGPRQWVEANAAADVALNVAALVASAGAATPALRTAQTAGRSARRSLTKTARDQLKEQAKNQLQAGLKWQKRGRNIERAQGWLENASNVNQASEMLVTSYEKGEFDFTTLAPSVADVEPTGILAVVNSFNKPICR